MPPTRKPSTAHPYPVVVRMTEELHQAIKDTAAAEDRSMAATMRRALSQYVAKSKRSR